jgi:hypothetical protein
MFLFFTFELSLSFYFISLMLWGHPSDYLFNGSHNDVNAEFQLSIANATLSAVAARATTGGGAASTAITTMVRSGRWNL